MFWRAKKTRKPRKVVSPTHSHRRSLRFEPLEERQVLSGIVDVQMPLSPPGAITLVGDGSNNEVEIRQTGNPGEYFITGNGSGTLLKLNGGGMTMPSMTVNGITGDITVRLGSGNDSFTFLGPVAGGLSNVPANLNIENNDGSNVNTITNTLINGDLNIAKTAWSTGYNELHISGATIIGDTVVDNVGVGSGDSWTEIVNSKLQGGGALLTALSLTNADGKDIIDVQGNSQFGTGVFIPLNPTVLIDNGAGGSRTTFTGASAAAGPSTTTVYGDLMIVNGVNLPGVLDVVSYTGANVLGAVTITNGDGDTETLVTNSALGSRLLPLPGNIGQPMVVRNGAGYDKLTMTDATLPWGLYVDNDILAGGASLWGSSTQINTSRIGTGPYGSSAPLAAGDSLQILGDNGADLFLLNGSTLGGRLNLSMLRNGNNGVTINNKSAMAGLYVATGSGNDTVTIDDAAIQVDVYVYLNGGADALYVRNVDAATEWPNPLLGSIFLDGGTGSLGGVDTTNVSPLTMGALGFEVFVP